MTKQVKRHYVTPYQNGPVVDSNLIGINPDNVPYGEIVKVGHVEATPHGNMLVGLNVPASFGHTPIFASKVTVGPTYAMSIHNQEIKRGIRNNPDFKASRKAYKMVPDFDKPLATWVDYDLSIRAVPNRNALFSLVYDINHGNSGKPVTSTSLGTKPRITVDPAYESDVDDLLKSKHISYIKKYVAKRSYKQVPRPPKKGGK